MFNMSEIKDIHTGEQRVLRGFLGTDLIFGGPSEPVMSGLGLWYDFRDTTNTNEDRDIAHDLSGSGNDGLLANFNYTSGSGYEKGGLSFDGVDDYIDLTGSNTSVDMSDFTISTWVTFEEGEQGVVFSNAENKFQFSSQFGDDSFMIAYINESGSFEILPLFNEVGYTPDLYKDGVFVTITVKNGDISLYLNNVLICSREGISIKAQDIPLTDLGRDEPMLQQSKFNVESVNVYDRALSNEEVMHNYLYELNTKRLLSGDEQINLEEGLLLHFDFKDRTNADSDREVAFDLSNEGKNGELMNFNYTDSSGFVGDGLQFDGVDDRLRMTPNQFPLPTDGFTLNTTHVNTENSRQYIFNGQGQGVTGYGFRVYWISSSRIAVRISGSAGYLMVYFSFDSNTVDAVNGNNLSFVINQNEGYAKLYIDGVFISEEDISSSNHIPQIFQQIGMMYHDYSFGRKHSKLKFKSVRVFNRVLSEEQVKQLYEKEKERHNLGDDI